MFEKFWSHLFFFFSPRKLSKSNSQTAHFHLLFHTFFFPAKAEHTSFLLVYDTLYVGDCRKPEKVAYPQVPHTTSVMCDGKAAFIGAPLRCVSQEKGSPNLTKSGTVVTKVRILRRVGKVRGSFRNQNSFSSDRKHDCNKH